jgi:tetratricopeptide (TPR) repeat protein
VAQGRGDLDEAINWYRRSLEIEEALGNRPGMAQSYQQLGIISLDLGELDKGERWLHESLRIRESLNDRPGIAVCLRQLGITAKKKDNFEEAEDFFRKSLVLFQNLGRHHESLDLSMRLADLMMIEKKLDIAEKMLRECLLTAQEANLRGEIYKIYLQFGNLYMSKGNHNKSTESLSIALKEAEYHGDEKIISECFSALSLLSEQNNNIEDAIVFLGNSLLLDKDDYGDDNNAYKLAKINKLAKIKQEIGNEKFANIINNHFTNAEVDCIDLLYYRNNITL